MSAPDSGAPFSNRELAALILPLFVEQCLTIAVGIADSMMIASVGEAAVSAVSLVDSIMMLVNNLSAALATGGAVIAGQYLGRQDPSRACRAGNQLIFAAGALGLAIAAILLLGQGFILGTVFGKITPQVSAYCRTYLRWTACSVPFIALYSAGAALFRTMGNSRVSMYVSLLMNVVNISGNALLIFGLKWGVAGVAVPTLCARVLAAVLILILFAHPAPLCLRPSQMKPDGALMGQILYIGLPNGVENSISQVGRVLTFSMVSTFGTAATAANAVGHTVGAFQTLPAIAISLALTAVVSRSAGAGNFAQVRHDTHRLVGLSYLSLALLNIPLFFALPLILRLYNLSPEASHLAAIIYIINGLANMALWAAAFAIPTTLRAAGDVRYCMTVSILSMWICRLGFGWLLAYPCGVGMLGIWAGMVLDWAARAVCFLWRFRGKKWERSIL